MINVCNYRTIPKDKIVVNTTSRSKNWSRGLSPFFLGPVALYDGSGTQNEPRNLKLKECNMITVKITFDDGRTITTPINLTLQGAKGYYLDNNPWYLSDGNGGDKLVNAVTVEQVPDFVPTTKQ